jgi:hypothetical protein
MPNPFKDWARMYGANKQYLESQGRPSSFLGQIGDIPNRIHEAADASEIGMKMMRHAQLTNGAGLPATVTIDGVWQVGSYMSMSPVLRVQGRVQREDGTRPTAPSSTRSWRRCRWRGCSRARRSRCSSTRRTRGHGDRLDPHRSARSAAARIHARSGRAGGAALGGVEQNPQQVVRAVAHQVVRAVEHMRGPSRVASHPVERRANGDSPSHFVAQT